MNTHKTHFVGFCVTLLALLAATNVGYGQSSWSKAAVCGLSTQGNQNFIGNLGSVPTNALEEALAHPGIYKSANVALLWSQIQPNPNVAPDFTALEQALATIQAYNLANPSTPLTATLQVFAGINAPIWAQLLDQNEQLGQRLNDNSTITQYCATPAACYEDASKGAVPALSFTDSNTSSSGVTTNSTYTIGHFWSAPYISAFKEIQTLLATIYDNDPRIQQVQITSCSSYTAEPFVLHDSGNATFMQAMATAAGGISAFNQAYLGCLTNAADPINGDYAAWQNTPLDFPFNNFTQIGTSKNAQNQYLYNPVASGSTSNNVMQSFAQAMGPRGVIGNHGLQGPSGVFMGSSGNQDGNKALVYTGQTLGGPTSPFLGLPLAGIAYYGLALIDHVLDWSSPVEFQFDGPSPCPAGTTYETPGSITSTSCEVTATNGIIVPSSDTSGVTDSTGHVWAAGSTVPMGTHFATSGPMYAGLDAAVRAGISYGMSDFQMWETTATNQAQNGANIGTTYQTQMSQLQTWASLFTCEPVTLAPCGALASSSTGTGVISQTSGSTAASSTLCPSGGTQATLTTVTQPSLCLNGTLFPSPSNAPTTTTTVDVGAPICTGLMPCGSTPSGSTTTTVVSQSNAVISATLSQCTYGGTQNTTTTVSQKYLCTNGTLTPHGAPYTTTVDTGAPTCNTGFSCGVTPSGSSVTIITNERDSSSPANPNLCAYGGTRYTIITTTQNFLCDNGLLVADGAPMVAAPIDNGPAYCNPASSSPTAENTLAISEINLIVANLRAAVAAGTLTVPQTYSDMTLLLVGRGIIPSYMSIPNGYDADGPWLNMVTVMGYGGNNIVIYYNNLIPAAGCRAILTAFAPAGPERPMLQYETPTGWFASLDINAQQINSHVPNTCNGVSLTFVVP